MYIGLMAYIKNDPIRKGIKYLMQCNGQLHCAQIGGQMAAGLGHAVNEKTADLLTELFVFLGGKGQEFLPVSRSFQ